MAAPCAWRRLQAAGTQGRTAAQRTHPCRRRRPPDSTSARGGTTMSYRRAPGSPCTTTYGTRSPKRGSGAGAGACEGASRVAEQERGSWRTGLAAPAGECAHSLSCPPARQSCAHLHAGPPAWRGTPRWRRAGGAPPWPSRCPGAPGRGVGGGGQGAGQGALPWVQPWACGHLATACGPGATAPASLPQPAAPRSRAAAPPWQTQSRPR